MDEEEAIQYRLEHVLCERWPNCLGLGRRWGQHFSVLVEQDGSIMSAQKPRSRVLHQKVHRLTLMSAGLALL